MSLRMKLIISFLALSLIPLFLVGLLTFHNYKQSLETTCLATLQDIAALKTKTIETYFDGLKNNIETAQGFYNIKRNLPILTRLWGRENHPEYQLAKTMLDEQLRHMQSVLQLSDIVLLSAQGNAVYSSNPVQEPNIFQNPLTEPEQEAFDKGKESVYLSDIFPDENNHSQPTLLITAPAFDFTGALIGIIVFHTNAAAIDKIIHDITGLGKTGEILIGKKSDGRVIFLTPLKFDPQAAFRRTVQMGQAVANPLQQAVQGHTGAGVSVDYRGQEVIAAWRHIASRDWGLVAKIDTREAFAEADKLRNLSFSILGIVFLLSIIAALTIAQSICRSLKKLAGGAAIIGSGNLDYTLGIQSHDEIGFLSRSFDKMTRNLKQTTASRDELNNEVAERKQTEEALRKERDFISAVLDTAGALVVVIDINGRITRFNRECENVTGYSHSEAIGRIVWEFLIPPEDIEGVMQTWKKLCAGDFPSRYENHWMAKNGMTRLIAWANTAITHPDGRIEYIIGTGVDITEPRRTEEALRRAHDELEIRVRERTRALDQTVGILQKEVQERLEAEKKIHVYQKRLRSLATKIILIEERERRAIASALHDSLGPLLAFSKRELGIIRKSAPESMVESLTSIHDKIKLAVDQTRNLTFDLSPPTLYTLGLEYALEELVEHFAHEGAFQGTCHIEGPIGPLDEDIKILLYRSARELLVNIVKHAQAKSVSLTLSVVDNNIQVAVQDDGVGFDVSSIDLQTGKMSGFGLFNIYERLIQAGGRIDIQSLETGGIQVILQLPLDNKKEA